MPPDKALEDGRAAVVTDDATRSVSQTKNFLKKRLQLRIYSKKVGPIFLREKCEPIRSGPPIFPGSQKI